ncbi:flavin-containing monooxygenase [Deinococcus pimensis]|uniref:flavin-containing monooxygenase n=1 Tax=Deinococcus pimensis TaxID=309888 RepID=UPI0004AF5302|nr:NAD(P)/FAD-dependent oxidoreductase [Deinococcus pimensis]
MDVLIIGGGQAGLALGYHRRRTGLTFLILDADERVGDSWRRRYDSLVLFTPAERNDLSGLPFPALPGHYPSKDEVASYLEGYARTFALPVRLSTHVLQLRREPSGFMVRTSRGAYRARQVIVATGGFTRPHVPSFAERLAADVTQVHSSQYRHPGSLPSGRVLMVGIGNSGAQIAAELAETHDVTMALGRRQPVLPQRLLGRDVLDLLWRAKLISAPTESKVGRWLRLSDPVIGTNLRALSRRRRLRLAGRAVDADHRTVLLAGGTPIKVDSVVWATGLNADLTWLQVPVLDARRAPIQQHGVTDTPGLYFLRLPWQRTRGSALLGDVGRDAAWIAAWVEAIASTHAKGRSMA